MATQIEICNLALSHLGLNGIQNILDLNPSAQACNKHFDSSVKDVLSESHWPFANVKSALTPTADTVLQIEWQYVYVYPVKALSIWNVYNESTYDKKHEQPFEVAFQVADNRKVICSNLDAAYAEQSYYVADTEVYSPKFVILLSLRLASNMGHILLGDTDVALKLYELYIRELNEAKRLSYSERVNKPKQTSSYVASR